MRTTPTTRLILLGALLLPGCQLKLDPSILPIVLPSGPVTIATTVPTTKPSVGPTKVPTAQPTSFMNCDRTEPAAPPTTGTAQQGAYNGQRLPNGYDALGGEAEVTAAIARVRTSPDWSCFQKFFPGASTVFDKVVGEVPPPSPSPRPTTMIGIWEPPPPPCREVAAGSVAINGMVFDQQGVPFASGVEVRVRNPNHSFSQDVQVENGHYYVYGAPAGEKLEITVVHEATGEARRRFVVPQAFYVDCGNEGFSVVNFGGPKTAEDPVGQRYPLPVDATEQVQGQMARVKGQVFDLWGNPLDGAAVEVTSLSAKYPFKARATVANGAYVVESIPEGVPVEFRVEFKGYRARARVGTYFTNGRSNVVNFGGDPTIEDPQGPQYGLAPLPTEDYRKPVVIKGKVRDIDGKVVRKGTIKVTSLEPEVPYMTTVTLVDGQYVINNLPAGIEIEFTIEADGFEPTWRYERVRKDGGAVNFGDGGDGDPEGASYGLVEEVEEADEE